jgi:fructokinase
VINRRLGLFFAIGIFMKNRPQVLCFGEILFDYLADQCGATWNEVTTWTRYPGGAPANVACGLQKLGIPSALIGRLGVDRAGQDLHVLLQNIGVNLVGLQTDPIRPTRLVYVTRSVDGDRQFAGFGDYQTEAFADTAMVATAIPESLFESAQFLVIGTIALASADSRAATEQLVILADKHQVKICLDLNWRPIFWGDETEAKTRIIELLPHATLLKCTDEEAVWLLGRQDPVTLHEKIPSLQGVLVTAGAKGCAYSLGRHYGEVPAFKVPVQDTTGAGDAFVAGFLAQALTYGDHLLTDPAIARQAVRYASAVGALTTLKPGAIAAQPSAQAVENFLQTA